MGVATVVKGTGARTPNLEEHARVRIEPTGRVRVYTGISPHGQGSETTLAQVAADALGVMPADVQVLHGDTDDLPAGQPSFSVTRQAIGSPFAPSPIVGAELRASGPTRVDVALPSFD